MFYLSHDFLPFHWSFSYCWYIEHFLKRVEAASMENASAKYLLQKKLFDSKLIRAENW